MRRSLFFFFALVAASCTAAGPAEDVGSARGEIINGSRETGRREVVAVARIGEMGGLCTGTAISRFAVLTAKHCVFDDTDTMVPRTSLLVVVGHDVNSASGVEYSRGVREVRTTPGTNISADVENGNDIAILLLDEDLGVPVRQVARDAPRSGEPITIVGFGRTMPGTPTDGDSGVKYRGTANVDRIGSRVFETTGRSWTCQGDSGGPALDSDNRVLGITSYGISDCTYSNSFYTRVDRHLAMIDSAVEFVPPCEPSTEVCDGVDNDCDGIVDNGCTSLGELCSGSDECAMGSCEDVGGQRVCVRDCDPRHAIPHCPFGFYCQVTGCGTGRCVSGSPGPKAAGEECASDLECESNHCLDVNGVMRCGRSCSPDGEACAASLLCEAPAGDCGSCVPVEHATGPRSYGAPCDTNEQCASNVCSEDFCTRACAEHAECGAGFHCRGGLCVRGDLGGPGSECVTSEDCDPDFAPECVDADGDLLCAASCDGGACSTPGFECGPSSAGDRCLPPGLPLGEPCAENGDCRTGICAGTCSRICDAASPCPEGFECRPAGEVDGCFPVTSSGRGDRGGCSAVAGGANGSDALGLLALLSALGAVWRRRR